MLSEDTENLVQLTPTPHYYAFHRDEMWINDLFKIHNRTLGSTIRGFAVMPQIKYDVDGLLF